jgi:hypothetical protein
VIAFGAKVSFLGVVFEVFPFFCAVAPYATNNDNARAILFKFFMKYIFITILVNHFNKKLQSNKTFLVIIYLSFKSNCKRYLY